MTGNMVNASMEWCGMDNLLTEVDTSSNNVYIIRLISRLTSTISDIERAVSKEMNVDNNILKTCMETVVFVLPANLVFMILSILVLMTSTTSTSTATSTQRVFRVLKLLVTFLMAMQPLMLLALSKLALHQQHFFLGKVGLITSLTTTISWLLHLTLLTNLSWSSVSKWSTSLTLSWMMCLVADLLQLYSALTTSTELIIDIILGFRMFLHLCFALTSFMLNRQNAYTAIVDENEEDGLPGPLRTDLEMDTLGVAKANVSWFSLITFAWVTPLISRTRLNCTEDTFQLPAHLSTITMTTTMTSSSSLLSSLFSMHKLHFFSLALLRLFTDALSFLGPILLNKLITFVTEKNESMLWGYGYALGISLATILASVCSTQFNLSAFELGMKVRRFSVDLLYKHTLLSRNVDLCKNKEENKENELNVVNLLSTDTDRLVRFSAAFHSVWAVPIQMCVALYLLYVQVGIAAMAGVAVAILMLPLNRIIANNIGRFNASLMRAKDARVSLMLEVIRGARSLKMNAWEKHFEAKVNMKREEEMKALKGSKYLDALCVYLWATTPVLISLATFTTFVLLGNELTAAKVFTSIALFALLTAPLNAFPWILNGLVEALVSVRRIDDFLATPIFDRKDFFDSKENNLDDSIEIKVHRASFGKSRVVIDDLVINKGDLVLISGPVGSGKTSLLKALVGNLIKDVGHLYVRDPVHGIALIEQDPWLLRGSVISNVLFDSEHNEPWYRQVMRACNLNLDVNNMSKGEWTEVGDNGSKLSGGQRARLALARAVYANKEMYFMDDTVFANVDWKVAVDIFDKCIMGLIKDRTTVLCTHQAHKLAELCCKLQKEKTVRVIRVFKMTEGRLEETDLDHITDDDSNLAIDMNEDNQEIKTTLNSSSEESEASEMNEQGSLNSSVLLFYYRATGSVLAALILLSLIPMQLSRNATDILLASWVNNLSNEANSSESNHSINSYLIFYALVAFINSLMALIRAFLFAHGGLRAAKVIHRRLLSTVLRAKMAFFDQNSVGRIINRFSSDTFTIDDSLPFILNILLAQICGVIGPLLVCVLAVPWLLILLVPLGFVYYKIQLVYRPASRNVRRLCSISLSPLYSHLTCTLQGQLTLRSMKSSNFFLATNTALLERSLRADFASCIISQWLNFRLQIIGASVVTFVALGSVLEHHLGVDAAISAGYVGLAVSYALSITPQLAALVNTFTETEREMVAVERLWHYSHIDTEHLDHGPQEGPHQDGLGEDLEVWPQVGRVIFDNVILHYSRRERAVLRGLTFDSGPRASRVVVKGRTGAGKSSIFQALLRLTEIESGRISIDSVDIGTLSLRKLREAVTVVPQEPFVFRGSLRENLDPLNEHGDTEIHEVISKCKIDHLINRHSFHMGLDMEVSNEVLSAGEKQLICLARAILNHSKLVLMDEATSSVDLETDEHIQSLIKSEFKMATVIIIAHRVHTVAKHCDKLLLVHNGQCSEETITNS